MSDLENSLFTNGETEIKGDVSEISSASGSPGGQGVDLQLEQLSERFEELRGEWQTLRAQIGDSEALNLQDQKIASLKNRLEEIATQSRGEESSHRLDRLERSVSDRIEGLERELSYISQGQQDFREKLTKVLRHSEEGLSNLVAQQSGGDRLDEQIKALDEQLRSYQEETLAFCENIQARFETSSQIVAGGQGQSAAMDERAARLENRQEALLQRLEEVHQTLESVIKANHEAAAQIENLKQSANEPGEVVQDPRVEELDRRMGELMLSQQEMQQRLQKLTSIEERLGGLREEISGEYRDQVQPLMYEFQERISDCDKRLSLELEQASSRERKRSEQTSAQIEELRSKTDAFEHHSGELKNQWEVLSQAFENQRQDSVAKLSEIHARGEGFGHGIDDLRGQLEGMRQQVEHIRQESGQWQSQVAQQWGDRQQQFELRCVGLQMEIHDLREDQQYSHGALNEAFYRELAASKEGTENIQARLQQIDQALQQSGETSEKTVGELKLRFEGLQQELHDLRVEQQHSHGALNEAFYRELAANKEGTENVQARLQQIDQALQQSGEASEKTVVELKGDLLRQSEERQSGEQQFEDWKMDWQTRLQKSASDINTFKSQFEEQERHQRDLRQDLSLLSSGLHENRRTQKIAFGALAASILFVFFPAVLYVADLSKGEVSAPELVAAGTARVEPLQVVPSQPGSQDAEVALEVPAMEAPALVALEILPEDMVAGTLPTAEVAFEKKMVSTDEGSDSVKEYVVRKDDNLWIIAKRHYGSGSYHKKIMEDNQLDSAELKPGSVLKLHSL